jgi:DNA gyrase subunit A
MQLRRLAALERQRIEDEYQECLKTIVLLEDLIASPLKILALVKGDMLKLGAKYGDPRRTQIVLDARESFDEEELIADKSVLISLTQRGYIKQTLSEAYRAQSRGGRGVNGMQTSGEDEVIFLFSARSHDTVLFFSNKGKVYALKAYQIPEVDRAAKGTYIGNLISVGESERITAALPISKEMMSLASSVGDGVELEDLGTEESAEEPEISETEDEATLEGDGALAEATLVDANESSIGQPASNGSSLPCVAMCTLKGRIKRVALSQFSNIRASGIICMSLTGDDQLVYVRLTPGNGEFVLVTAQGQALRFDETLVRRMGRTASGVRAMRLKRDGDYIAGMEVVEPNGFLLTVTERGFGKCTSLSEYPAKGRGGGGVRTLGGTLDVTGLLIAARVVQPSDQITLISAGGVALRQRVSDIPQSGRAARGSHLINLREGDSVASVARLAEVVETDVVKSPA